MAALALALTVSLSGCMTIFGGSPGQSGGLAPHSKAPAKTGLTGKAAQDAPKVGSCWRGTYEQGAPQVDSSASGDAGPVNCSDMHQLYTYAVLPLPRTLPKVEISHGVIDSGVYDAGVRACVAYIDKHIGRTDDQNGRLDYKNYLPSESDWAGGARWVSCDLTVFRLGSLVAAPELENLPTFVTLKRQAKTHEFDLCTNVPGVTAAAGPRAAGAVFASCSGNPEWTYFHYFGDNATNPSYPTPAEFKAQFEALCTPFGAASGAHVVPWYPTAEEWADGTQGFECWGTS